MDNLIITRQSGVVRTVCIDGDQYNVSHLFCGCAGATIALAPDERDQIDSVSVKINCPEHGTLSASAVKCGLTFRCEPVENQTIFAWVNARHERDRRVAWGMKRRTA